MGTDTKTWLEFPNGGKAIVEQILVSEDRNTSKRAGLRGSQSEILVGKLTIGKKSFGIDLGVHQVYKFHENRSTSPSDGC